MTEGIQSALQKILSKDEPPMLEQERIARIRSRIDSLLPIAEDDKDFMLSVISRWPTWLLTKINKENEKGRPQ